MSRIEQFIKDHREEFDSDEPSKKVWENVREQMVPGINQETPVIGFTLLRWCAAAAVVILTGTAVWYYINHTGKAPGPQVAVKDKPASDTTTSVIAATPDSSAKQLAQDNKPPTKMRQKEQKAVEEKSDEMSDYNEEMYHYTKLIEIKHNELKKIEKDEPLLYRKFSGDVHKLDSVYHTLQKQLPHNANREQLLEAMIQNLQLQIGLLNHQLLIIKQINHSKKSAYEKAYKSA